MSKRFDDARRYTKKYSNILLPCRYCKSKNIHITSERTIFEPKNIWCIVCDDCGDCIGDFTSVKKAIERWNSTEFRSVGQK